MMVVMMVMAVNGFGDYGSEVMVGNGWFGVYGGECYVCSD
jgi:hypothetical protein